MTLAEYLDRHELTHDDFSKKSGVPRPTITRLVKPGAWPSKTSMAAIQRATEGKVAPDDWSPALSRAS